MFALCVCLPQRVPKQASSSAGKPIHCVLGTQPANRKEKILPVSEAEAAAAGTRSELLTHTHKQDKTLVIIGTVDEFLTTD